MAGDRTSARFAPAPAGAIFWQRLAVLLASCALFLGIVGQVSGAGFFAAFALDGYAAFLWGALYGLLAWMARLRYRRVLVAVVVLLVIDGARLVMAAGDAGEGTPWLALVLRAGLAVPVVMAALVESEAASDRGRRPPTVAHVPRRPSPTRPSSARPARPGTPSAADRTTGPPAGVRAPRVTSSVLTTGSRAAGISLQAPQASVDAAADSLRFVVRRCEIHDDGLRVTPMRGAERLVEWARVRGLWVRSLPPERPWEGQIVVDVVVGHSEGRVDPVRIFSTTLLPPPAGAPAGAISRVEILRRLARHIVDKTSGIEMDSETRAFVEGSTSPYRLVTFEELAAREETYDSAAGS